MNVLQLVNSFHPVIGGVEKHVLRVSEELAAMGHEVTVVSQRLEPDWPPEERLGEVRVVRLPHRPGWRALRATLSPLVEQADVLHAHDAYALLRWHLPVKWVLPRRPTLITFHGYEGYPITLQARILRLLAERVTVGSACIG